MARGIWIWDWDAVRTLLTGRVPLSSSHSRALAGQWQVKESIEYLLNQGALDETDPNMPRVENPDYVNSPGNCLAGSDFHAIYCVSECEVSRGIWIWDRDAERTLLTLPE